MKFLIALFAGSWCCLAPAVAQQEADLCIAVSSSALPSLDLHLPTEPMWAIAAEEVIEGLLGIELTDVFVYGDDDLGWFIDASIAGVERREGLRRIMNLDLAPLIYHLRSGGYSQVWLNVTYGQGLIGPPPVPDHPEFSVPETFEGQLYYAATFSTDAPPPPLHIAYGYSVEQAVGRLLAPHFVGLAFLMLMLFRVRRALSGASPADVRWFGYITQTNYLVLLYFLAFLFVAVYSGHASVLHFMLHPAAALWREAAVVVVVVGGMLLWQGLAAALSARLYRELRGLSIDRREVVKLSLLTTSRIVLPFALAYLGLWVVVSDGYYGGEAWTIAIALLVAAIFVLLRLNRLLMEAIGFTPDALTSGDLRERVNAMGERAGVRVREVFVIPAGPFQMANAFAMGGGNLALTRSLLDNMSRREVDAILAHELAHLKKSHPRWLFLGLFVVAMVTAFFTSALSSGGGSPLFFFAMVVAVCVVVVLAQMALHRRFERTADRLAVELTRDPEALISAYGKLARLNMTPMQWSRVMESSLTHPSMARRIERIAQQGNVQPDRVEGILRNGLGEDERYPLPDSHAGANKVFNTRFKQRTIARIVWGSVLLHAALPVLLLMLADALVAAGAPLWLFGIAALSPFLSALAAANYLVVAGMGWLQRGLRARLHASEAARFVSMAPHVEPLVYEGYTNWDAGFLQFEGDWILYRGEEARFALHRDHVRRIVRQRLRTNLMGSERVLVVWADEEGVEGSFAISASGGWSMLRNKKRTRDLARDLAAWAAVPPQTAPENGPAALPALPEVTGQTFRDVSGCGGLLMTVFVTVLTACIIGVLAGFTDSPREALMLLATPCLALVGIVLGMAPLLISRRKAVADESVLWERTCLR